MSCKYCEYPSDRALSTNKKVGARGDTYVVDYDVETDAFLMFTWDNFHTSMNMIEGVKYCPFCGEKFRVPNTKTVEDNKRWRKDWEERKKQKEEERKKEEREHQKWVEREYKKNPYDPTKPRLKDKNFRNAVKYLAKYMGIKEFYWDDDMRSLTGWDGGYIKLDKKAIGPCYETNGVMESYHDSGRTYTVEELCYGFKEEEE